MWFEVCPAGAGVHDALGLIKGQEALDNL